MFNTQCVEKSQLRFLSGSGVCRQNPKFTSKAINGREAKVLEREQYTVMGNFCYVKCGKKYIKTGLLGALCPLNCI